MIELAPSESFPFQPHGWTAGSSFDGVFPSGGVESILIVDDEPSLRALSKLTLCQAGYRVLTASSGVEALEILNTQLGEIPLMILDLMMPIMSGQQVLARLPAGPMTPSVLISSGYSSEQLDPDHLGHVLGFLKKPYRPTHLLRAVRCCLDERVRRKIGLPTLGVS